MPAIGPTLEVPSKPKSARSKTGQGRNRQDNLTNYWQKSLPDQHFDGYDWRGSLIRRELQGASRIVSIDTILNGFTWSDESPIQKATVTLTNPDLDAPLPVKPGHEIKIDWSLAGKGHWTNLLRLRVKDMTDTASTGSVEAELVDELDWFSTTKEDWSFKKGKKNRPRSGKRVKGWRADQVAREVCRIMGIPCGKLAKGKHLITNLTMEGASPMAVITKAYKLDRDNTGRRFVIAMKNGRLTVTQLRRSKDLLYVGGHLLEAGLRRSLKKNFATVVTLKGTAKKEATAKAKDEGGGKKELGPLGAEEEKEEGKGKKEKAENKGNKKKDKLEVEVKASPKLLARYGRIRADWTIDDPVASKAALRHQGKVRLAKSEEENQELTMTLPGIPTVARGDAMKAHIPAFALTELIYVTGVTHTVSGSGSYTMEVTAGFEDPFVDKKGEEIREKLCEKAKKKGRVLPTFCSGGVDPFAPALPRSHAARNRRDRAPGQTGKRR